MAIVIQNVSKKHGFTYGKGKQVYDLRLNYRTLVTFEHKFEDRMASCLRAAADALEKEENK